MARKKTPGTTGTGLDLLPALIAEDEGLALRIPIDDIDAGARAADRLNGLLVDAIRATGVANDGRITASDIHLLDAHVRRKSGEEHVRFHGDDEGARETGFHRVQNDGATTRLFALNAVDTVADGIYHIGFGIEAGRLVNEDGDPNASLVDVAYWLDTLLAEDLESGVLDNRRDPLGLTPSTGTGLDRITETILADEGLRDRIPTDEIVAGARAADAMNGMIVDAIRKTGVAADGRISAADVADLSDHLSAGARGNRFDRLHGDDEGRSETGFHLVQGDGSITRLFDSSAIDTVADGIYHLGFGYQWGRLINEDGNANARLSDVARWLEGFLADELADGTFVRKRDIADPDEVVDKAIHTVDGMVRVGRDGAPAGETARGRPRDETLEGGRGDDRLSGGEGDDHISGGAGFDIIAGGGGSDLMMGGAGDDHLLSVSDTGAPRVGQLVIGAPTRPDPDGDINYNTLKIKGYGDQPALGDDVLVGGPGADLFEFRILTSGMPENVREHIDRKGVIDWRNVQGENDALMDHWAEGFGIDIIADYEVGKDQIAIIGHTANLETVRRRDVDGDGTKETILTITSDQGANGGAHTYDLLGYVVVFGDPVKRSDVIVHAHATYGIVETIDELPATFDRAAPVKEGGYDTRDERGDPVGKNPFAYAENPSQDDVALGDTAGRTRAERPLSEGTITFDFRAKRPDGDAALFSTDAAGVPDEGAVDIFLDGGKLKVRLAGADDDVWLVAHDTPILANKTYTLALTFDAKRAELWLDGEKIASGDSEGFRHLADLDDAVLGARETRREARGEDGLREFDHHFNGRIGELAVFDEVLSRAEIAALAGEGPLVTAAVGKPALRSDEMPAGKRAGTGLEVEVFDTRGEIETLSDAMGLMRSSAPTGRFTADFIDFGGGRENDHIDAYFGLAATVPGRLGRQPAETFVTHLEGFVYVPEGTRDITIWSDDGFRLSIGGRVVAEAEGEQAFQPKTVTADFKGGLYPIEFTHFENGGGEGLRLEIDGLTLGAAAFYQTRADFHAALDKGRTAEGAVVGHETPRHEGTTGTGLDRLVALVQDDPGLERSASPADIFRGAKAADALNGIILSAIERTGVAEDGVFSAADVYAISRSIRSNDERAFIAAHGDDEDGVETGFHLVQGDGGRLNRLGEAAIDGLADSIYHLGFRLVDGRLTNEDGDANARAEEVAHWLNVLLADDLAAGRFGNEPLAGRDPDGPTEPLETTMLRLNTLVVDDFGV